MKPWVVVLAGLALVGAVPPAAADDIADCTQSRSLELKIKACTLVIKSSAPSAQKAAAFRNRGAARSEAGAYGDALSDYNESLKFDPANAAALAGRAQARLTRADVDGALADYNEALKSQPTAAHLFIARGHARLVKGLNDLAVADLSEAIRLNPKSASAYNNRGLAYRKMGDFGKAIDDYSRAVEINPIYALAYANRGHAHEANGAKTLAVDDYGRALILDPSLVDAASAMKRLGAPPLLASESDRLQKQGAALVETHCARCHATGRTGTSSNAKAPEFRTLQQRHPVQALREPLSRGLMATHEEMPKFILDEVEVDAVVAYINSLPEAAGKRAKK